MAFERKRKYEQQLTFCCCHEICHMHSSPRYSFRYGPHSNQGIECVVCVYAPKEDDVNQQQARDE